MTKSSKLIAGIEQLELTVTSEQLALFERYIEQLDRWRKTYNLISVRDSEEIVVRHLLDSLAVAPYLSYDRVLDVGSGAGFPGIPLAILFPNKQFVLLDANSKKVRFLTFIKAELRLTNIDVVHSRVEAYQPAELFPCIITRAFAALPEIVNKTKHLYAEPGVLLALKAKLAKQELNGIKDVIVQPLRVPYLDEERHLLSVKVR